MSAMHAWHIHDADFFECSTPFEILGFICSLLYLWSDELRGFPASSREKLYGPGPEPPPQDPVHACPNDRPLLHPERAAHSGSLLACSLSAGRPGPGAQGLSRWPAHHVIAHTRPFTSVLSDRSDRQTDFVTVPPALGDPICHWESTVQNV